MQTCHFVTFCRSRHKSTIYKRHGRRRGCADAVNQSHAARRRRADDTNAFDACAHGDVRTGICACRFYRSSATLRHTYVWPSVRTLTTCVFAAGGLSSRVRRHLSRGDSGSAGGSPVSLPHATLFAGGNNAGTPPHHSASLVATPQSSTSAPPPITLPRSGGAGGTGAQRHHPYRRLQSPSMNIATDDHLVGVCTCECFELCVGSSIAT